MDTLSKMELLINEVNPDVDLIEDPDFASAAENQRIFVGEAFDEDFAEVVRAVYKKAGIHFSCSLETFALLHELGHIETLKDIHEEDYQDLIYHYEVGKEKAEQADTDFDQFYQYIQLPLEQLANDWATTFIETHPSLVAKLDRTMVQYQDELKQETVDEYLARLIIRKVI